MGLEASNYTFYTKENHASDVLAEYNDITHDEGKKYALFKEDSYLIEIEVAADNLLSIRVALCNPQEQVLNKLDDLFRFILRYNGVLTDLNSKKKYESYTDEMAEEVRDSYLKKREVFKQMYGDYTAALSSEQFYKRMFPSSE